VILAGQSPMQLLTETIAIPRASRPRWGSTHAAVLSGPRPVVRGVTEARFPDHAFGWIASLTFDCPRGYLEYITLTQRPLTRPSRPMAPSLPLHK
jgi:hypothetical protein